jgi:exonuclease VII large subunit
MQTWLHASAGVVRYDFRQYLRLKRAGLEDHEQRFGNEFQRFLRDRRTRVAQLHMILAERSPQALLDRGYSITRDKDGKIVRDASRVAMGEEISVRFAKGSLEAVVKSQTRN